MSDLPPNAGSLVGERLGKYELLALLALGGTGEIYLARIGGHAGFEKYVVVKCLHDHLADDAEFVRMFLDEARLGAQLDHSNIVQTLELGEHEGRYYMAMEYLAGMSMALIAKKAGERLPSGRLPVELVLGLAVQACSGLHYAHDRSAPDGIPLEMVHRDISPQNLVVSFEGVLKLVDFGIAKAALRETHTKSGTIKGKFAYMSPEQCLAKHVDRRTDIFALGTIVWEFLTGRRLFKRNSSYETYQAIVKGEVRPPSAYNPDLDPTLDRVVMKALAYRRDDRYPTAEAFGEALVALLHQRGTHVSASDVSRFFDQHFTQELNEHAQRMRQLISGRTSPLDDMTWDVDPDSDAALRMPDDMPEFPDDDEEEPAEDEDEGEATRIELNPMARFEELNSGAGKRRDSETEISERRAGGKAAGKRGPAAPAPAAGATKSLRPVAEAPEDGTELSAPPASPPRARSAPEARTMFNAPGPSEEEKRKALRAFDDIRPRRASTPPPTPARRSGSLPLQAPPSGSYAPVPPAGPHGAAPSGPHGAAPSGPHGATPPGPPPGAASGPPPGAASGPPSGLPPGAPAGPHPGAPAGPHQSSPSGQHPFPPVQTPTAFRSRADMIQEQPPAGTSPGSDLALLHAEQARPMAPAMLAAIFVAAAAVGIAITLLIGALL